VTDEYDLIVIGAGSGGITAAPFAARLGAKVALVEAFRPGGDCLYTGCVPSKALIRVAHAVWDRRHAGQFGLPPNADPVDLGQVMAHVREVIDRVYQFEQPHVLQEEGADLILGSARFLDGHTISINGERRLRGKRFLICTGARPRIPDIAGLNSVRFLTYQDVFQQTTLPAHLLVIGAGPIGLELAQAFLRLGSAVTIFCRSEHILNRADHQISQALGDALTEEGMHLHTGTTPASVASSPDGRITVHTDQGPTTGDALLIATGRTPNLENLDLAKAGVTHTSMGVPVDDQLRTNQAHIYACGDVVGDEQFTHYAAWQGYWAARNALLPGHAKGKSARVPWTIFTDPEVARVGVTEAEARHVHGDRVRVALLPMERVDRAQTEGNTRGFIKVVLDARDRILGAHIIAARAGDLIQEYVLAMDHELTLSDIARSIHVYPTFSTGNQQVASNFALASALQRSTTKLAMALGRRKR
jgi:pyruvate/2-oxoglutarate dehydrogenase complex dihydrolipoamide dehydrogenase (E3) component